LKFQNPAAASASRAHWRAGALVAAALLTGCAPQTLLLRGVADQLSSQASATEDDLGLAREASAFYLKLAESVLIQTPGHLPLAAAVAGGYTQYAYAFVEFEAERIEPQDAKAAKLMRERAARLYARAQRHAMAALEQQSPGLKLALAAGTTARLHLPAEQVAVAYWAAASWGASIALSKDSPDAVADLPQAIRLAHLAWDRDPDYGDGALATLMGQFELARPGGTRQQAQTYFERAVAVGAGRSAGPYVAQAEALALPAGDRAAFEGLLHTALQIAATHRTLANEVMRERAQWLLDTAVDRF
jgi:predicted anti-sigma-YlaC factor YlaD